jgi:hypothetical protein
MAIQIDPSTGKPYVFSPNTGDWTTGYTLRDGINPDLQRAIGFDPYTQDLAYSGADNAFDPGNNATFAQFLQGKNLRVGQRVAPNGLNYQQLFDASNNPTGQQYSLSQDDDPGGYLGLLWGAMAGGWGAGTAATGGFGAAGAGSAGGGTTAGLSGSGIGADSLAYGSLENGAAYGGGYGSSLTASAEPGFGGALGEAGSGVGGDGAFVGEAPWSPTPGGGAGGFGGATGATNPALIDSAAGTPGYGASSAGGGGGVGDLSGIAGPSAGSSLGTQLQNLMTNGTGGLSGLGQGLLSAGVGGLTGLFGGGNTGDLNKVNYQQAATAMGQSARTNQTNAQGSLTYNQNGVDAQGNPTYSQDVKLNAPYQANLNQALGNQSTALGNLTSYNQGLPDAYKNVPGLYGNAGSQQALAQQQQDAMYDQQKRYLDPQYDLQSKQLQAQLANQGVTYGTDAYNNAMTQFGSQQNQAYGAARDSAINSGNQYANTLFNQNLAAHNAGMADITSQGSNYLGQSNNALNGVVQNPTFAQTPAATNYLGAAQLQGNANLNQYNAKIGNTNNLTNGLTGIGQGLFSNPGVWSSIGTGLTGLFGG